MKKQEVIKKAYGTAWDHVKDYVDENGFVDCVKNRKISLIPFFDVAEIEFNGKLTRPKSLRGIENNNGWIKIDDEYDLPEYGYYEVIERATGKPSRATLNNEFRTVSLAHYFSHYRPIEAIDLPLY